MDQDKLEALLAQADALYADAQLVEALGVYESILAADETNAWAHNRRGAILAQIDRSDEAEAALKRAIELDPNLAAAHSNLGNIFYSRGDYSGALDKYKQALDLDGDNPVFHENLHAAYKKLGRVSEAVGHLKRSYTLRKERDKAEAKERFQTIKKKTGCLGTAVVIITVIVTGSLILF